MPNPSRSNSSSTQSSPPSLASKLLKPLLFGLVGLALFAGFVVLMTRPFEQKSAASSPAASSVIFSSPHSFSKPVVETRSVKLNAPVPDFSATDIDGKTLRLADWKGNLGLLFFADLSCPCVQAYNGRMKALQKEFSSQGLQIAYVFSDAKDSRDGIRKLVKTEQYPWRNVRDGDQQLLRLFNVQCTTEVFLIDREGILRYHGHVDDSTFEPESAKAPDLKNAIVALLNNQPVKVAETQAYACTIPRIKAKKASS